MECVCGERIGLALSSIAVDTLLMVLQCAMVIALYYLRPFLGAAHVVSGIKTLSPISADLAPVLCKTALM